jgi:hypothetical protein
MPTLILSPRYTPDSISLWRAANEMGWQVERPSSWRVASYLRDSQPVVYGEPLFAAVVAQSLDLAIVEPPLSWLAGIPYPHRLRDIEHCDLGKARRLAKRSFIKPADDKCFPARVYGSGLALPSVEVLPDSIPVLISEPVTWQIEFRCFVLDRQPVALSVYARNGDLAQDSDGNWPESPAETKAALDFATRFLADDAITLPPSVVIDLGIISNRGWAVVEANASWASGIYGCEPSRVLQVLARACKRKEDLTDADASWIVVREEHAS